jgi:hypothetical protein
VSVADVTSVVQSTVTQYLSKSTSIWEIFYLSKSKSICQKSCLSKSKKVLALKVTFKVKSKSTQKPT